MRRIFRLNPYVKRRHNLATGAVRCVGGSGAGNRFGRFCRQLRDGKPCVEALASAYPDLAASPDDLERAWRKSLGGALD